jgi:hypothetical protein
MSHVSRPVKGSLPRLPLLPPALATALGEPAADSVVEPAELDVVGVVAELDPVGAVVELDDGADVFRLLDCDELDGCEPAEPLPFAHASGSTYCWSPAETPGHDAADADADTESPAAPIRATHARLLRHLSTAAVLQSLGRHQL